MDSDRYRQIGELFLEACELEPDAREEFLARAGAEDPGLRTAVESLLVREEAGTVFEARLAAARDGAAAELPIDDSPPSRIGRYHILDTLGKGGMGIVYLAEQREPVRRRVALKQIKRGMDSKEILARFESERQALALMNHPNIAKVFDAGATEQGVPYFVMEFVEGIPINDYCDRNRLSMSQRLELFVEVCEGVQHAHQKGIIHRDLKPSNILVAVEGDTPVPKIIDFGVAKAIEQRLTEHTVYTAMGQIIGTPEYMSPEQADLNRQDVDTRTDVYALGVLLYELLVGALPFEPKELRRAGFDEIRRRIREVEPPKPSTRISSMGEASTDAAHKRRTEPGSLARQLRGDLDWITMQALEKDRTRRYRSPSDFAADVRRHLEHRPVLAGPPSARYKVGKFIRRHRVGVAFGAVLAILLIGFSVREAIQSRRVALERDRAREEADAAREVTDFLVELFEVPSPHMAQGEDVTAREVLDHGAERVRLELAEQPVIQARLMYIIGLVYTRLGLYEDARPLLEQANAKLPELLGEDDPLTLHAKAALGWFFQKQGLVEEADPLITAVYEARRRTLGEEHPDTLDQLNDLGVLRIDQERYSIAEEILTTNLEDRRRVLGDDSFGAGVSRTNLARLYHTRGRFAEAVQLLEPALESFRRNLGDRNPDTLWAMQVLAINYSELARLEEAETLMVESVDGHRHVFGPDDPATVETLNGLAMIYQRQGRFDEAERLYLEVMEMGEQRTGEPDLGTMLNLGTLYLNWGRYDRAEFVVVEALEHLRRTVKPDAYLTLQAAYILGWTYTQQGRYAEAEPLLTEALKGQRKRRGADDPVTVRTIETLTKLYEQTNDPEKARPLVAHLLSRCKREAAATADPRAKNGCAWSLLTCVPEDLREPELALKLAVEANGATEYADAGHLDTLALAYHLNGQTEKAVETQGRAISLLPEEDSDTRAGFQQRLDEFEAAMTEPDH